MGGRTWWGAASGGGGPVPSLLVGGRGVAAGRRDLWAVGRWAQGGGRGPRL